jgi:hypothetical protein
MAPRHANERHGQVRICQCPASYFMCEQHGVHERAAMQPAKNPAWIGRVRKNKPKSLTFPEKESG